MVKSRRRVGLVILNVAAALVIVGSLYDLGVPQVPANHLSYVGDVPAAARSQFARLDLAMLRSIGGCLLAIGIVSEAQALQILSTYRRPYPGFYEPDDLPYAEDQENADVAIAPASEPTNSAESEPPATNA